MLVQGDQTSRLKRVFVPISPFLLHVCIFVLVSNLIARMPCARRQQQFLWVDRPVRPWDRYSPWFLLINVTIFVRYIAVRCVSAAIVSGGDKPPFATGRVRKRIVIVTRKCSLFHVFIICRLCFKKVESHVLRATSFF
jgi:hypothetical protein